MRLKSPDPTVRGRSNASKHRLVRVVIELVSLRVRAMLGSECSFVGVWQFGLYRRVELFFHDVLGCLLVILLSPLHSLSLPLIVFALLLF